MRIWQPRVPSITDLYRYVWLTAPKCEWVRVAYWETVQAEGLMP